MELKNKALIKLFDTILKYHKELMAKPANTFGDEDRLMMKVVTELKAVVDKYVAPKED